MCINECVLYLGNLSNLLINLDYWIHIIPLIIMVSCIYDELNVNEDGDLSASPLLLE